MYGKLRSNRLSMEQPCGPPLQCDGRSISGDHEPRHTSRAGGKKRTRLLRLKDSQAAREDESLLIQLCWYSERAVFFTVFLRDPGLMTCKPDI